MVRLDSDQADDGNVTLEEQHLRAPGPIIVSEHTPSQAPLSSPVSSKPPSSHTPREFRRLIDAFHDGVLVATKDGIAFANQAFLQLLEYTSLDELMRSAPQRLIRKHVPLIYRSQAMSAIARVLRSQATHEEAEQQVVTRRGRELFVQYYFDGIEFEEQPAIMITLRDITESRSIAEKLNRAERMASVGTLAAGVAHEINNPLAYVTTNIAFCMERIRYIEELLDGKSIRLDSPASLRAMLRPMAQALTDAHQGTSRVATIVRDLSALTRDDKEFDSTIDVPTVLASAIHMSESETKYRCTVIADVDRVGSVIGNETRLAQIFLNLIVNAAQAFTTEDKEANRIRVVAREDGDDCIIEVHDNGPGIPPENMRRIFDPFFTTKPVGVGTGLGLSICHGLVDSMQGSISVKSEVGVGTTFSVVLRVARTSSPISTKKLASISPSVRARVLIVDDEPLILRSVARLLKDEHDVETAANGKVALTKLMEDGPFDLIVCDLMMPEMNGMDLHQEIAKTNPDIARRFVFLTGGAYTDSAKQFLSQVPNPKLDKPIQPNLLRSVVRSVLRG